MGVGVLTYQLLTGHLPYSTEIQSMNAFRFMTHIGKNNAAGPELTLAIPPMARAFCETVLERDPTKRPTAEELLHHPFLLT